MGKKRTIIGTNIETGETKTFKSARQAERETGANISHILSNVEGKRKSAGGWVFAADGQQPVVTTCGQKGRPSENKNKWWGGTYHFTDERKHLEKVARYDRRGLLSVEYNFHAPIVDNVAPHLDFMRKIALRKLQIMFRRCIVVYEGMVSKVDPDKYYIFANITVLMPEKPTETQLRKIERIITDVRYEDEFGRNDYNIERIGKRIYSEKYADIREKIGKVKKHRRGVPIIATNIETGEEKRYENISSASAEFDCVNNEIWYALNGYRKKFKGYTWKYA